MNHNPDKYVFIAVNDADYLAMSVNLAISLRANGETLPFHLITNIEDQVDRQGMFEAVHQVSGKVNPFHMKTRLPEFVDNAIYLDADSIAFSDPVQFAGRIPKAAFDTHFQRLSVPVLKAKNHNHHWCNPRKVAKYYGFDLDGYNSQRYWHEINSSFLYVNRQASDIWKLAEHFYSVDYYPEYQHEGFFNYPDELAFETALCATDFQVDEKPKLAFWEQSKPWNFSEFEKVKAKFPIFSLAGAGKTTNQKLWEIYNREGLKMAREIGKHWNRLNMGAKIVVKQRGKARFTGLRLKTEGIETLYEKYGIRNPNQ